MRIIVVLATIARIWSHDACDEDGSFMLYRYVSPQDKDTVLASMKLTPSLEGLMPSEGIYATRVDPFNNDKGAIMSTIASTVGLVYEGNADFCVEMDKDALCQEGFSVDETSPGEYILALKGGIPDDLDLRKIGARVINTATGAIMEPPLARAKRVRSDPPYVIEERDVPDEDGEGVDNGQTAINMLIARASFHIAAGRICVLLGIAAAFSLPHHRRYILIVDTGPLLVR